MVKDFSVAFIDVMNEVTMMIERQNQILIVRNLAIEKQNDILEQGITLLLSRLSELADEISKIHTPQVEDV
jgi:hypothetical protein